MSLAATLKLFNPMSRLGVMGKSSEKYNLTRIYPMRFATNVIPEGKSEDTGLTFGDKVLNEVDAFSMSELVTVEDLIRHRVHLGHKTSTLNPLMSPYIYGNRFDQLVFDLQQTRSQLIRALNFVAHIAFKDGIILFVSRNHETAHEVESCAESCKEYAHTREWKSGLLTNSLNHFGSETRLPDCGIFLTTKGSNEALREFSQMLIPSVAIVDSDQNPKLVTFMVAGNDDTAISIKYYCGLFRKAITRGKEMRMQNSSGE